MTTRRPTVALAVICHNRPVDLVRLLASAECHAFDEVHVLDMASTPPLPRVAPGVSWHRSELNRGVSVGRNLLLRATAADIVVMVDDDAYLSTFDREHLVALFRQRSVGWVAFKIVRGDGNPARHEVCFRGRSSFPSHVVRNGYFIGAGFALSRAAALAVGGFDEGIFYQHEEVDLSFRLHRAGYIGLFTPHLTVMHQPSPVGRALTGGIHETGVKNMTVIARTYFPRPLAALTAVLWMVKTLPRAIEYRDLSGWLGAIYSGSTTHVDRQPLSWRSVIEIYRLGGRVPY